MKNNSKLIKRYSYIVMVAIGALLSMQSFAQRHSAVRGGGSPRSYSPGNGGGFHHDSRPAFSRPSGVSTPRPNHSSNQGTHNQNGTNFQRPPREIVRNNTTINNSTVNRRPTGGNFNRPNTFNRPGNHFDRRGGYAGRPTALRNYHPIYNAHNPSWRYNSSYFPRRNTVINVFPYGYSTINYGGFGYRYYNGIYYRPYQSSFIVCAPPLGLYINTLPFGYRRIYVNDYPYYYYNGTYYDETPDNTYKVVLPPLGAIVESIPEGYETITVDGETYYQVDGIQYKPVVQDNGEVWYQVIKVDGQQQDN